MGSATGLNVQGETTNAVGQTLRRVVDTTGSIIKLTFDSASRIINTRVISQATGRP